MFRANCLYQLTHFFPALELYPVVTNARCLFVKERYELLTRKKYSSVNSVKVIARIKDQQECDDVSQVSLPAQISNGPIIPEVCLRYNEEVIKSDAIVISVADKQQAQQLQLKNNSKRAKNIKRHPKYPLVNMGNADKTFTSNYEKTEKLLQSLNISTDELAHYPDVQDMSEEEILLCATRLKDYGLHVIFSLFMIQRIFVEIQLEQTVKRAPTGSSKQWYKLRNGMYRLTSIRAVVLYKELCQLLEKPDLDLFSLLDKLADHGIYDHQHTIVSKVRQLLSIGAKPHDILTNLELLKGSSVFKMKIKLYRNLFQGSNPSFPVKLFLSATLNEFRDKLRLGDEINHISKLLGVKPVDFLMCWGFKHINSTSLAFKIQMCLRAGVKKQDIFNNISMLNRFPLHKCQSIKASLLHHGQTVSLYDLKDQDEEFEDKNIRVNGMKDWTFEDKYSQDAVPLNNLLATTLKNTQNGNKNSLKPKKSPSQSVDSSKLWRMKVFEFISHLLQLEACVKRAMFKANVNVDSTQLLDITKNLDHLTIDLKFTRDQIVACPLVLAHPHQSLQYVTRHLQTLLNEHCKWSSVNTCGGPSKSNLLTSSPSDLESRSGSSIDNGDEEERSPPEQDLSHHNESYPGLLLSDPVFRLNALQYFLERDNGFSLTVTETLNLAH